MKISATVITLNEEKNIAGCLESLDFAAEIIVLDSGSTDRTEDICRSYPKVRFISQEWLGYGGQKNRAAEVALHDWILSIDADERVTLQLREEIVSLETDAFSAARMPRENYFGERWIRHCGWYPDYTARFYDRKRCRFREKAVHESLEHDGKLATLKGHLIHYTYTDIADYLQRMDRYSTLSAREMFQQERNAGILSLFFRPLATFLKMYLLRRGFLEGLTGLLLSSLYAQYTFCKYAKLEELQRTRDRS